MTPLLDLVSKFPSTQTKPTLNDIGAHFHHFVNILFYSFVHCYFSMTVLTFTNRTLGEMHGNITLPYLLTLGGVY